MIKKTVLALVMAFIVSAMIPDQLAAQKIKSSPSLPVYTMDFLGTIHKTANDTLTATDSSSIFYAPYDMFVVGLETTPAYSDSGAGDGVLGGDSACVVSLRTTIPSTSITTAALASILVGTPTAVYYASGLVASPVKITAGQYYKLQYTLGTSDKFKGIVRMFYTR